MNKATDKAHLALSQAADDMTRFYDAHWREVPLFEVRDRVWINGQNITTTQPMKKLDHKWLGPYSVKKVISQSAYRLKLPSSFGQTHSVFSVTLLRPYSTNTIAEKYPPPPVIKDGVEEYEVEHTLDSRVFRNELEYLVCWKGYRVEEDEWRPAKDIKGARQLVLEFHHRNPEVPQYISSLDFASLPLLPISNFINTPDTVPSGWATGHHMLK